MVRKFAAFWVATLIALPAAAQNGAFNIGQLTGTVSQDAVTQSEARRAQNVGGGSGRKGSAKMKSLCAQRFAYSVAERASEDGQEIERMCRAEGF